MSLTSEYQYIDRKITCCPVSAGLVLETKETENRSIADDDPSRGSLEVPEIAGLSFVIVRDDRDFIISCETPVSFLSLSNLTSRLLRLFG